MLPKEYRIPMPISVEEYKIGQLYMIAKHSAENTKKGEGIEVITNEPCESDEHGPGQFTEKRIHLGGSLPGWLRSMIPKIFYITEKAWNHYPYTITEYTCSFVPRFKIRVETKYENNAGTNDEAFPKVLDKAEKEVPRDLDFIDIAYDEIPDKHKEDCPDLTKFKSTKTGRGPLEEGWIKNPPETIMCSYKLVKASFEVWGLQTKVEKYVHKTVRDVLLVGHNQAFAWIDEWFGMSLEDIREYEAEQQAATNAKIKKTKPEASENE